MERQARIMNLVAKKRFNLEGTDACTQLISKEADISNICQYKWYEWCYYRERTNEFPCTQEVLGRVLGPAKNEGNEMDKWILKANGKVVPRCTLRSLSVEDLHNPIEVKKREVFDSLIKKRWGDSIAPTPVNIDDSDDWEEYEDEIEEPRKIPEIEDIVDEKSNLLAQQPTYDKLINTEVSVQAGDRIQHGKFINRSSDPEGNLVGMYDDNPCLTHYLMMCSSLMV